MGVALKALQGVAGGVLVGGGSHECGGLLDLCVARRLHIDGDVICWSASRVVVASQAMGFKTLGNLNIVCRFVLLIGQHTAPSCRRRCHFHERHQVRLVDDTGRRCKAQINLHVRDVARNCSDTVIQVRQLSKQYQQ